MKPFSTSFQRQLAIFQRRFNVETTSLCLLGILFAGLAPAPTWQNNCITADMSKLDDPKLVLTPSKHKTFV